MLDRLRETFDLADSMPASTVANIVALGAVASPFLIEVCYLPGVGAVVC